jgi:hypothetical protein
MGQPHAKNPFPPRLLYHGMDLFHCFHHRMKLARSLVVEDLKAEEGNRKLVVRHSLLVGCRLVVVRCSVAEMNCRLVVVNSWAAGGKNCLAAVHSSLVVVHNLEAAMQDMVAAVRLTTMVSKEQ